MATFLEGTRGSGKSKYAVSMAQNYMNQGRPVATNLDLFLHNLQPNNPKASYTRVPDYPRSEDLIGLGKAYPELDPDNPDTYDESRFGIVIIDELLTSFNSRNWNDPDRFAVVNWIVQSRKYGWNLYLIGQDIDAVDKQIRETVVDELFSCRSSKALFGGLFFKTFIAPWFTKLVPKFHICRKYDGKKKEKGRFNGADYFRRNDLHNCYKTSQQFKKDERIEQRGTKMVSIDERASKTILSNNYFGDIKPVEKPVEPKEDKPKKTPLVAKLLTSKLFQLLIVCLVSYFFYLGFIAEDKPQSEPAQTAKTKKAEKQKQVTAHHFEQIMEVPDIYITGAILFSDGRFDYAFAGKDGQTVRPQYSGYQVDYVNDCHAKLKRNGVTLDVYCSPIAFSWSNEPELTDDSDSGVVGDLVDELL